jgi:hypothetical protein
MDTSFFEKVNAYKDKFPDIPQYFEHANVIDVKDTDDHDLISIAEPKHRFQMMKFVQTVLPSILDEYSDVESDLADEDRDIKVSNNGTKLNLSPYLASNLGFMEMASLKSYLDDHMDTFKDVKHLVIESSRLKDDDFAHLANLGDKYFPKCECISLKNNHIGFSLKLSESNIFRSNPELGSLYDLLGRSSLRWLNLRNNPLMRQAGVFMSLDIEQLSKVIWIPRESLGDNGLKRWMKFRPDYSDELISRIENSHNEYYSVYGEETDWSLLDETSALRCL